MHSMYITAWGGESTKDPNSEPNKDSNPSQNDQEVLALAKANVVSQLNNFGYSVTEDAAKKSDLAVRFYVSYQPERWPLIDRSVSISGKIYELSGPPVLKISTIRMNSVGLIGALVGPSRDDMVAEASREVVVKIVDELRKGTKEAKPAQPPVARSEARQDKVASQE